VKIGELSFPAVTNIGVRPTFEDALNAPVIETHLLDFQGDLYQSTLEITFIERIREERKFPGPEKLLKQISQDIARTRTLLERDEEG
jgi:riboflavin kinase/FMN adenylyltransferase